MLVNKGILELGKLIEKGDGDEATRYIRLKRRENNLEATVTDGYIMVKVITPYTLNEEYPTLLDQTLPEPTKETVLIDRVISEQVKRLLPKKAKLPILEFGAVTDGKVFITDLENSTEISIPDFKVNKTKETDEIIEKFCEKCEKETYIKTRLNADYLRKALDQFKGEYIEFGIAVDETIRTPKVAPVRIENIETEGDKKIALIMPIKN